MAESLKDNKSWVPPLLDREFVFNEEVEFAVVGDMHLSSSTPKSRIDDYPQTMVDKLSLLRRHLLDRGINKVILLGDIFHKSKQPSDFEFRVAREFLRFKEDGIKVFCITGNHDLQFDRLDTYEKSSLGLMYLTDVLIPFSRITFKREGKRDVNIYGCHYPNDIPDISDFDSYNILAAHKFYEFNMDKDSIRKEDLEKNGFSMYLLGHDHVPYDLLTMRTSSGVVRIVRPGSFSRGTAHAYNNTRMVYIDIVRIKDKVEVVRDTLQVKKPEEIFSASVLDKLDTKDLSNVLSKQLSDLVTKLYESDDSESSVYKILDSTQVDPKVKGRIEGYLYDAGIFRRSNDMSEDNLDVSANKN